MTFGYSQGVGLKGYYRTPDIQGNTIAFCAERDIWTVPIEGGLASRLTTHPEEEIQPSISPDGKTIAFSVSCWTYERDFSLMNKEQVLSFFAILLLMPTQTRQLAAIMFTDIVGYTALMGKDSNKAMELVRQSKRIQKPLVEKHHGLWIKEMGDGVMAQFGSALDAVNCALEIQRTSRADFEADLRIGIHLGDITIENNDVYGDGVNVAARLESIADPGGIYISESIEKAIRGQSKIQAKYLGESQLKNVDYGVPTYAVQGVGLPLADQKKDKELSGRFLAEIKRRGVIRAGISYVLTSLLLVLIEPFVSKWITISSTFNIILLIALGIGFPIALYLAWRFERSPTGFVRSNSEQSWQNPPNANQRKTLTGNIIMGSMVIIILLLFFYPSGTSDKKMTGISPHDNVIDKSIAILPFANRSNDPDQEYFSDGITEDIINRLSQIEDLRVIARTSSFAFKGKEMDIREIGKKLEVSNLLEGSVQKIDNRIRITARLIRAADGSELWSKKYDHEMLKASAVFDIQDEISLAIVDQLKVNLLGNEKKKITKRYTNNLQAYDHLMKGWYYLFTFTPEGLISAIESFDLALQIDSEFAEAHAAKGHAYLSMPFWGNVSPKEVFPKAKESALSALALDSTIAEAYNVLAFTSMMYDWNFKAADFQFNKALELNPNIPLIHVNYSIFLILTRHYEEALYEAKTAVGLDPISRYYNTRLGSAYLASGDIDKAIEIQQMTISMNPNYFMAYQHLGDAYIAKSMTKEAIDAYQQAADLSGGNPTAQFFLGGSYFLNDELEKAKSIFQKLEERSKNEYISSVFFFYGYLVTGNADKSFICLQQAIEDRDSLIPWISQYQGFGKIPEEPRFQKLMREAGF